MTLLTQTALFLGAALLIVPLAHRLGLATVLGYLLTGLVLGPNLLNVAGNAGNVMHFAEYGVVMLLFLIGLELEPSRLWAPEVRFPGYRVMEFADWLEAH